MPNGKFMRIDRGAPAGRSSVISTDEQLQLGVGPDRIDRLQRANNTGKVGPNVNAFPMTYGLEYVGAAPLVHVVQGITLTPSNAIDDTVSIPATFAGNPLP